MKIIIETIPHETQRYPTVGDWYWEPNDESKEGQDRILYIKVSKLSDCRREALIAVHELVEVLLCMNDDITAESVDAFDMEYEKNRPEGDVSEPGDSPKAPYRDQHCFATEIERLLAAKLGVCWSDYETELEALP